MVTCHIPSGRDWKLYLRQRKSEQLLDKLEDLQTANRVWIPTSVDVKMIREDRNRR